MRIIEHFNLEETLPNFQVSQEFTSYLRSLRELHKLCTEKTLPSNYRVILEVFENKFYGLFMEYGLSMTLKIHVILEHYAHYFEKTGLTFRHTNAEFTESCHSTLRQSEEKHGLDVKKALGTPVHQSRSWQSLVIFNSKRAGYTKPLRLKKKSSPRVSSPSNDPFSKLFKKRFPQAVSLHYQLYKKMKPQNNNL